MFEALNPGSPTALQLNHMLKENGTSKLGPVPAEGVVVGMGILLPAGFTQADVAALEDAVESIAGVQKAIVCAGLKAPAAEWTPANHDIRFALQARLTYESTAPPE